jgi:hypothetical protein
VEACRTVTRIAELVFLRLGLLQADDVGVLARQPLEEAPARGGANAVRVERDDAHRREV